MIENQGTRLALKSLQLPKLQLLSSTFGIKKYHILHNYIINYAVPYSKKLFNFNSITEDLHKQKMHSNL